jgi:2,4-dienoyl-CoA reductase-like NADH-dependent reductase (Old Yellow Enzyme family)
VALPKSISALFVWVVQSLDWLTGYRLPYTFLRLLTANNLAYTTKDLLNFDNYVKTFERDCRTIFRHATSNLIINKNSLSSLSFQSWLNGFGNEQSKSNGWSSLKSAKQAFDTRLDDISRYQLVQQHRIAQEWQLGPIKLKNRVIKAATYECMGSMDDGVPTNQLVGFHEAVAAGGAGMTIVAYGSVSYDGRSFPTQICLSKEESNPRLMDIHNRTKEMLIRLTEAVHRHGCKACIQITHAGAFNDSNTNLRSTKEAPRGPSSIFNPLTLRFSHSLNQDETTLQRIEDDFAFAVHVCQEVGFDAIELHLGHGYLLSQFLSRRTNPKYANDPQARLAFPLRVVKRVVAVAHGEDIRYGPCPKEIAVLVKFNVSELTEEDLTLSDCRIFARAFYDSGADLLVPSGGHVMVNGLHMLRGKAPVTAMANAQTNLLKGWIVRLLGPWLIPEEPYREAFFLERVLSVCFGAGVPLEKICLIGGLHDIVTMLRAIGKNDDALSAMETKFGIRIGGHGFGALQLGRALLADEKYCLKVGIAKDASNDLAMKAVNCCDNSNSCIVDAFHCILRERERDREIER